jgi:hypothetical protein
VQVVSSAGLVVDTVNFTTGIRTVEFDADRGLLLNSESVKVRGFCDHSNWGGVGNAVPDRVNFFRAQMLRSVGGNAWRMAHNPPIPARINFADRLGVLIMDENRDYGGHHGQGGYTQPASQPPLPGAIAEWHLSERSPGDSSRLRLLRCRSQVHQRDRLAGGGRYGRHGPARQGAPVGASSVATAQLTIAPLN